MKNYPYKDIDGNHWPDAALGDELFYCIDYNTWITEENDSLVSITWVVPDGLEGSEAHEANGEAFIKLKTLARGSHRVEMHLRTKEFDYEQVKVVPMILKVY